MRYVGLPPGMEESLRDDDEIIEAPKDKQPSPNGARRRPACETDPVTGAGVPGKPIGGLKSGIGSGKDTELASNAKANLEFGYDATKLPTRRQAGIRPVEKASPPQGSTNDGSQPLTNIRYETFAQEIAKGASTVEAYERAGFKRHTGNASKLSKRDSVKKRTEALTAQRAAQNALEVANAAKAVGLSRQNILDRMDQAVKAALAAGNFAGVIRGLELMGREFNLFTEKRESGKPGEFAAVRALTDEELDRQIAEELAKMKSAGRA